MELARAEETGLTALERVEELGGVLKGGRKMLAKRNQNLEVAMREVREESGMETFEWLPAVPAAEILPLDIDVHVIPARRDEAAHEHFDVRFLFRAANRDLAAASDASDARWLPLGAIDEMQSDASVMRAVAKLRERLD